MLETLAPFIGALALILAGAIVGATIGTLGGGRRW